MKPSHPHRWLQVFALLPSALLLAVLLTGCAGVIPIPTFPNKVQRGERLTSNSVEFIQPGLTTRDDVVAVLGPNHVELPAQPAIAYSWEVSGGGGVWWIFGPYGGASGSWVGGWRAFFVAFDEQGVVRAAELKRVSPRRSLHQQLREWIRRLPDLGPSAHGTLLVAHPN